MKPEDIAAIINTALAPYRKSIEDLDSVLVQVTKEVKTLAAGSNLTVQEMKTFVTERISDIHVQMLRDRDTFKGDAGPQGERGLPGERGDPGTKGERGDRGLQGEQGIAGDTGTPGVRGEQGEPGLPGAQGKQGPQGTPGDRGADGKDGRDGKSGERGERGTPGTKGDRGEKGERGLPGERGLDGRTGPQGDLGPVGPMGVRGEAGPRGDKGTPGPEGKQGTPGERGHMSPVTQWEKGSHVSGSLVHHKGATWQARHHTQSEPSIISNHWELLTNGLAGGEFKGHKLAITLSNGDVIKSPNLKGDRGEPGLSVRAPVPYQEEDIQVAGITRVKHDGCVWTALKDGCLHKPGANKSKGQWINDTHRGPPGKDGKDADEERIEERLWQRWVLENQLRIETTVKQVEQYFNTMDLGFND